MNVSRCIRKFREGIEDFYFDALWDGSGPEEKEEEFFLKSFKEYVVEYDGNSPTEKQIRKLFKNMVLEFGKCCKPKWKHEGAVRMKLMLMGYKI